MKQKILSIYVNLQDKELNLPSYLKSSKFIISICPASIMTDTLSKGGVDEAKLLLENGCLLGQRGYMGRCRYRHDDGTDPWHENYCLYNPSLSPESQLELMVEGKRLLEEIFGVAPQVYAPINHLWDVNTLSVAEVLGYPFLMDQNNIGLVPYNRGGIAIIPEVKIIDEGSSESVAVYCHVNQLRIKKVVDFIRNVKLVLPSEIKARKTPPLSTLTKNEIIKLKRKIGRDLENIDKR